MPINKKESNLFAKRFKENQKAFVHSSNLKEYVNQKQIIVIGEKIF